MNSFSRFHAAEKHGEGGKGNTRHINNATHAYDRRANQDSSRPCLSTSNRRLAVMERWFTSESEVTSASGSSSAGPEASVISEPAMDTFAAAAAAAGCHASSSLNTGHEPAAALWRFTKVSIHTVEHIDPPLVVSSQEIMERLGGLLQLANIAPDSMERETGIKERKMWPAGTTVVQTATWAARKALDASGVAPGRVGVICSTSVSRDCLEPSAAVCVQHALGLPPSCMNLDVSNACMGMMNGMLVVAGMIESGVCEYGLVVCSENSQDLVEATLQRLSRGPIPADLRQQLPTLTLGCGATAMLLCRSDLAPAGANHRLTGAVVRAAPQHCDLCYASDDKMYADASAMLVKAVPMFLEAWGAAKDSLGWSAENIDLLVPHQVSMKMHAKVASLSGVDPEKFVATYPERGNVAAAGVIVALSTAHKQGRLQPGNQVALAGFGSGLNCMMAEVIW